MNSIKRPKIPFYMIFVNYFGRLILLIFGLLSEVLNVSRVQQKYFVESNRESYPKLYGKFFCFWYRHITSRFLEMLSFPLCSMPDINITILERDSKLKITGRKIEAINFGSYNYLGYSQNSGPISDSVEDVIKTNGVGVCSSSVELGRQQICVDLEKSVAKYLGTEDAIIFGMGFGANAYTLSALLKKGCLVLSDELNHASIILGCRLSGAVVKIFKHNNMIDLERIVRNSIVEGQPSTGRVWTKIIVIIEGIYSMEGTIANLPQILILKKTYKLYVYLDEAHSVGAMGKNGRGICDYYGIDPKDVDILMGTFSKSFAAAGGYMAGHQRVIEYMRCNTPAYHYAHTMSPPLIQQIQAVVTDLSENWSHSQWRVKQLRENAARLRGELIERGYHIDGHNESPVIPIMVYSDTNSKAFVDKLMESGIATVGVGYPVTSILGSRLRICVSGAHTSSMIDYAIDTIDRIGKELELNFSKK